MVKGESSSRLSRCLGSRNTLTCGELWHWLLLALLSFSLLLVRPQKLSCLSLCNEC